MATILDYEATGPNAPYLIMDLIPGHTLGSKDTAPMDEEKAVGILIQLCEAMIHAHSNDVIHRDLKPSNVIVDHDAKATILDFGIAKDIKGVSLTQTGQHLGTAGYMAPEQLDNSKSVTETADIYSLGAILYYCLTGLAPYEEQGQQLVFAVLSQDPRSPREINSSVSKEMNALVMKCLKRETSKRFQTCEELISALKSLSSESSGIGMTQGAPWFILILFLFAGAVIGSLLLTFQPSSKEPLKDKSTKKITHPKRAKHKEERKPAPAPEPDDPPIWIKPIGAVVTFATKEFRGRRLLSSFDRNMVRVREKGMKMYFTTWSVEQLGKNYYSLSVSSMEDKKWYLTVNSEPSKDGVWWVNLTEKPLGLRSTWQLRESGRFVQLQSAFASLDRAFVLDIYDEDILHKSPAHRPIVAPLNKKRRYQLWRQR
ncbi:MAG: serine/threonine-protein kinase [Planctomycetota bacterium]|nr:serine/threonine-protein kinase [Planctomycetota bacterium]